MESESEIGVACFWLESEPKKFFKYAEAGVAFLGVRSWYRIYIFFFGHSNSNFCLIAGSYSHINHLNDSKISKQKYGSLRKVTFLKRKLKTILALC